MTFSVRTVEEAENLSDTDKRQFARSRLTRCRHRSRPPERHPKVRQYNKGQSLDSQREQRVS